MYGCMFSKALFVRLYHIAVFDLPVFAVYNININL